MYWIFLSLLESMAELKTLFSPQILCGGRQNPYSNIVQLFEFATDLWANIWSAGNLFWNLKYPLSIFVITPILIEIFYGKMYAHRGLAPSSENNYIRISKWHQCS